MNNCQIVYGPTEDDDEHEDIVKNFIPDHRSFQIKNLQCNTSYWLVMTCTDIYGSIHNSSVLNFTTGKNFCRNFHTYKMFDRQYLYGWVGFKTLITDTDRHLPWALIETDTSTDEWRSN